MLTGYNRNVNSQLPDRPASAQKQFNNSFKNRKENANRTPKRRSSSDYRTWRSLMRLSSGISEALDTPQLTAFSPACPGEIKTVFVIIGKKEKNRKENERMHTLRRLLVVLPIAERTTTGFSSGKLRMRSATSFILSAEATEDPPNFITTVKLSLELGLAALLCLCLSSTF